tara:strand:+ start:914 stop:1603 length:690 start_codon:yes stop_codon:yes gene_type:complete
MNDLSSYSDEVLLKARNHIKNNKTYDITIYSIVKFFHLAMENNPNMVDVMFLPRRCVLHSTLIYEHIRDNRKLFLHKGSWHKFRGYSFSQMSKINKGTNASNPKRQKSIEEYGYDVKFAYHVIRLLLEVEQIMETGDLELDQDREVYKSIRRGEWSLAQLNAWAKDKEADLEALYAKTDLQREPPEDDILALLIECLEMHYGSLDNVIVKPTRDLQLLNELKGLVNKYE